MAKMEHLELQARREAIESDVRNLVERYRTIFEWDVPDIDEPLSDRLIVSAIREALDRVESGLFSPRPR